MKYTLADLQALPPTLSVPEAAKVLGIGKDAVYRSCKAFLAGGDGIACLRIQGSAIRVLTRPLVALLEIEPQPRDTQLQAVEAGKEIASK